LFTTGRPADDRKPGTSVGLALHQVREARAPTILLLEDSDIDAELITLQLERADRRFVIVRATERASYVGRLGDADVVLADYSVPGFEGMEALDLCQSKAPDTPFIFVSGVIGEEFATDALKRGATDYVMKHRLNRLPAALDRALKEADDRRRARLAEGRLGESQRRLQATVDNVQVGILEVDPITGIILRANPALHRMLGYSDQSLVALQAKSILLDDEARESAAKPPPAGTRVVRQEKRLVGQAGEVIWADMSSVFVAGSGVSRGYVLTSILDITNRKHTEEALRESELKLRLAAEAARLGNWEFDPRGGQLILDARCRLLCGFSADESIDYQSFIRRCHFDDRPRLRTAIAEALRPGGSGRLAQEFRTVTPERRVYWLAILGQAVVEDGISTRFVGFLQDITRQKRTEEALQRSNEVLEARVLERTLQRDRTWQLSRDLMMVADPQLVPVAVNPAWSAILDWTESELFKLGLVELLHPDDETVVQDELHRLRKGLTTQSFEARLRHRDDSYRAISWTWVLAEGSIYAVGRDVTDEKLAHDRLRQAQKIETIGQLTGGVAHDFNNLLTVIVGNLESVHRHLRKMPEAPATVRIERATENAMQGAQRASVLTQRLLAFSRRQPLRPRPLNLNKLISGMSDLLVRTLGAHITIDVVPAADLWFAMVDPNQLENSILNLAINARDAMANGGRLTIATANITLDRSQTLQIPELPPGQYVTVGIYDTGSGMSDETIARAFEPFFTTKDVGHGTGLGLSQVYGFVKQSGGHVRITSDLGQGTLVRIYLPRELTIAEEAEGDSTVPVAAPESEGNETILVVEDNEEVRAYSTSVLQELGYSVVQAANGAAALQALRRNSEIRLLFTDVGLPEGMNGRQLADAARDERPEIKVLFTSGYEDGAITQDHRVETGIDLISKPFSFQDLAERVRAALDSRRAGDAPSRFRAGPAA
jgi:PAS domain S-box-containing protein